MHRRRVLPIATLEIIIRASKHDLMASVEQPATMMMMEGSTVRAHGRHMHASNSSPRRERERREISFNAMPKEPMPSQPRAHRLRVPDAGEKRMWSRLVAYGQAHGSCCRLALARGWLAGSDHIHSLIIVVVTCSLLPRQNPPERACALLCDGVPKGGSGV